MGGGADDSFQIDDDAMEEAGEEDGDAGDEPAAAGGDAMAEDGAAPGPADDLVTPQPRPSTVAPAAGNEKASKQASLERLIKGYFVQMAVGCGKADCSNLICRSNAGSVVHSASAPRSPCFLHSAAWLRCPSLARSLD